MAVHEQDIHGHIVPEIGFMSSRFIGGARQGDKIGGFQCPEGFRWFINPGEFPLGIPVKRSGADIQIQAEMIGVDIADHRVAVILLGGC